MYLLIYLSEEKILCHDFRNVRTGNALKKKPTRVEQFKKKKLLKLKIIIYRT